VRRQGLGEGHSGDKERLGIHNHFAEGARFLPETMGEGIHGVKDLRKANGETVNVERKNGK
jgi:hypothetical protein